MRSVTRPGSRYVVVALIPVLVLLLSACAQQPATRTRPPHPGGLLVESEPSGQVQAGNLVLTIRLPSAALRASSDHTATVTVANVSTGMIEIVKPIIRLRIVNSAGAAVLDTMPRPLHSGYPGEVKLRPGEQWAQSLHFTVPPQGKYLAQAIDVSGAHGFREPAVAPLESVP